MHISKLSGIAMDSVFVGLFEPMHTPPDTACAWVLGNGAIVSVDATFSDWFAYPARELASIGHLPNIVTDSKALMQ